MGLRSGSRSYPLHTQAPGKTNLRHAIRELHVVELDRAWLVQGQKGTVEKHQVLFLERQRESVDDADNNGGGTRRTRGQLVNYAIRIYLCVYVCVCVCMCACTHVCVCVSLTS